MLGLQNYLLAHMLHMAIAGLSMPCPRHLLSRMTVISPSKLDEWTNPQCILTASRLAVTGRMTGQMSASNR